MLCREAARLLVCDRIRSTTALRRVRLDALRRITASPSPDAREVAGRTWPRHHRLTTRRRERHRHGTPQRGRGSRRLHACGSDAGTDRAPTDASISSPRGRELRTGGDARIVESNSQRGSRASCRPLLRFLRSAMRGRAQRCATAARLPISRSLWLRSWSSRALRKLGASCFSRRLARRVPIQRQHSGGRTDAHAAIPSQLDRPPRRHG